MTEDSARETEEEVPEGNAKRSLRQLAQDIIRAKNAVADLEEALSVAKAYLRELEQQRMPNAMASINSSDFKFQNGVRVSVSDDVVGSIPKEEPQRQEALEYLQQLGGGDLYKTTISIPFMRRQHNMALDLAQQLRDKGYDVEVGTGVHHTSLGAWARERIAKGEDDVDWLRLGLQRLRKAKVTLPKGETAVKFD